MKQNIKSHSSELSICNQPEITQPEIWQEVDNIAAQDTFGGWGNGGSNGLSLSVPGLFIGLLNRGGA